MPKHFILSILVSLSATAAFAQSAEDAARPRNVILFIADGCGPASLTLARDYLRYQGDADGLALDPILVGAVRTYASNSRVTDSAASATAYASGVKTYNGAIGVDSLHRPVATLVEAAEARGMATGLVATSRITHATPAAFAAHVESRASENDIAAQQMTKNIDVLLGGGTSMFVPKADGGSRDDGRNLLDEARAAGYTVAQTLDAFDAATRAPLLGLFDASHMAYEIDRDSLDEPSLAEMTRKAIDLLNEDPEGFFLMVEGSRIDHAAHGNDAAAHLHDVLAFDEAIAAALAFARQDGETLLVATSDHETGGLTIGRNVDGRPIYQWYPEVLDGIRGSHAVILTEMLTRLQEAPTTVDSTATDPPDRGEITAEVLQTMTGIEATDEEKALLQQALTDNARLNFALAEVIGRHAILGWSTGGHTAVDVGLYAIGPGSVRFHGNHDNTVIGLAIADLLGLDLPTITASMQREAVPVNE